MAHIGQIVHLPSGNFRVVAMRKTVPRGTLQRFGRRRRSWTVIEGRVCILEAMALADGGPAPDYDTPDYVLK